MEKNSKKIKCANCTFLDWFKYCMLFRCKKIKDVNKLHTCVFFEEMGKEYSKPIFEFKRIE